MRIFRFTLFLFASATLASLNGKIVEKCITVTFIQEKINGNRFAHRIELVDGKRTELWSVNGAAVNEQEYEDAIVMAEREECRTNRQREYEKERKRQDELMGLQQSCLLRLLTLHFHQIEAIIKRFSDPRLIQYFTFNSATITNEQYQELITQIMPHIAKIIDGSEQPTISELNSLVNKLESYPERIEQLYWATIKLAQEQSNDTRLLKDLLSLTTEHLID